MLGVFLSFNTFSVSCQLDDLKAASFDAGLTCLSNLCDDYVDGIDCRSDWTETVLPFKQLFLFIVAEC